MLVCVRKGNYMKVSGLVKKISIYFIGMMSSKILSVLLIPIYAFYVKPEDLGYYDFILTIKGVIIPIIYLAIWESILRFLLAEKDEEKKRIAVATSAFFSMLMTFVLLIGVTIYSIVFDIPLVTMVLILFTFITYGMANIWQYYARGYEETKVYVYSGIFGTITNFISVLLFLLVMDGGVNGLLLSYVLGQLIIVLFIELKIKVFKNIKSRNISFSSLKKMLLFSSPLVLNLTSIWLMSAFGRYLIFIKLGKEANGLFSFANKFSLIITLFGSVVTSAIIEEAIISSKTKGFELSFQRNIEKIFKVFQSLALLAVPSIIIFYSFIENTDYYNSIQYAPWLLIYSVATIMSSNVGAAFQAIDKTKYQFSTTVAGALVTVLISFSLISYWELYAVIVGQIFGAIVMLLMRYKMLNKFVDLKIEWKHTIIMTLIFITLTFVTLNYHVYLSVLILIIILIFMFYKNFSLIKKSLLNIKNNNN